VLGSLIYSFSARSSDFYFRVPSVFLLPKSDLGCFVSLAQSGTWASVSHWQLISIFHSVACWYPHRSWVISSLSGRVSRVPSQVSFFSFLSSAEQSTQPSISIASELVLPSFPVLLSDASVPRFPWAQGRVSVFLPPATDVIEDTFVCVFLCGSLHEHFHSWVIGSKDSRFFGLNCSFVLIFQTCPPDVRWNACEDINCSSIQFLSSISLVVLLAPFCAAIPSLVLRADSLPVARQSWPS
jgi:hypothetical protein